MLVSSRSRPIVALAAVALLAAGAGCAGRGQRAAPNAPPYPFVVRNHGFFDVNVYVVRSAGGPGTRLTTVGGNSSARLAVRRSELQPGGTLVVRLHAIGTRFNWESPGVQLADGLMGQLDVYTNNEGEMTRSVLSTAPVAAAPAAPPRDGRAAVGGGP